MAGALALQDSWLHPDVMPWALKSVTPSALIFGFIAGLLALGVAGILLIARSAISFKTVIASSLLCLCLGAFVTASVVPKALARLIETYGYDAYPNIGVAVAGATLIISLGMIFNGMRRKKPQFIAVGTITLGLTLMSAIPVVINDQTARIIYVVSAFLCACVSSSFILPENGRFKSNARTKSYRYAQ